MKDDNGAKRTTDTKTHKTKSKRPTLGFDIALYDDCLNDPNLSEGERRQILETLWTMICCFIDLGYSIEERGIEAEQSCEQLFGPNGNHTVHVGNVIESAGTLSETTFTTASAAISDQGEREET